mgnify:FL=1
MTTAQPPVKRPPLGPMPENFWLENRIAVLAVSLAEYAKHDILANRLLMAGWAREIYQHLERIHSIPVEG